MIGPYEKEQTMIDREKIVEGLSTCARNIGRSCHRRCPYYDKCTDYDGFLFQPLLRDTLELLKEQEPKTGKWILDDEDANSWECSECGGLLQINDGTPHENDWHFCPYCGSKLEEEKVKLDG